MFLNNRLYWWLTFIIVLFLIGFSLQLFILLGKIALFVLVLITFLDFALLYNKKNGLNAIRSTPDKLSNGDNNKITITIYNYYNLPLQIEVIDEVPIEFQWRDMSLKEYLPPLKHKEVFYFLKPHKRGSYLFGATNVFVSTRIGLIARRYQFYNEKNAIVYPSFLQMKQYEIMAFSKVPTQTGIKKIRRIGHNLEFEQIREYVQGDDYRSINWKATARKSQPQITRLMVNQYQDEKSQQVYAIIDKGRLMQAPFQQMTLLDYAINASLAISNIVIKKQDKAGLITFNHQLGTTLKASNLPSQLKLIMDALYLEKTSFKESNFEQLFLHIKHNINQRSLLLFFTNFATLDSLNRQIIYLKKLTFFHVVVVIFFEDTELETFLNSHPKDTQEIYLKTIAEKFAYEKRLLVKEMKKYGIHAILSKPQELTLNTINKYLELKAKGTI
ncbi:MAG: DUF58 domain-containing protein [Flammeovirgaceae bacterium]